MLRRFLAFLYISPTHAAFRGGSRAADEIDIDSAAEVSSGRGGGGGQFRGHDVDDEVDQLLSEEGLLELEDDVDERAGTNGFLEEAQEKQTFLEEAQDKRGKFKKELEQAVGGRCTTTAAVARSTKSKCKTC